MQSHPIPTSVSPLPYFSLYFLPLANNKSHQTALDPATLQDQRDKDGGSHGLTLIVVGVLITVFVIVLGTILYVWYNNHFLKQRMKSREELEWEAAERRGEGLELEQAGYSSRALGEWTVGRGRSMRGDEA